MPGWIVLKLERIDLWRGVRGWHEMVNAMMLARGF